MVGDDGGVNAGGHADAVARADAFRPLLPEMEVKDAFQAMMDGLSLGLQLAVRPPTRPSRAAPQAL
jgi:hypothetical protein